MSIQNILFNNLAGTKLQQTSKTAVHSLLSKLATDSLELSTKKPVFLKSLNKNQNKPIKDLCINLLSQKNSFGQQVLRPDEISATLNSVNPKNYKLLEEMINSESTKPFFLSVPLSHICNMFTKFEEKNLPFIKKAFNICNSMHHKIGVLEYVNKNNSDLFQTLLKTRMSANYDIDSFMRIFKDIPNANKLFNSPEKLKSFNKDFEALSELCNNNEEEILKFTGVKNLLVSKYTNPQKYNKLMKIVHLVQQDKLPLYITKNLSSFGEINPLVMSDVKKVLNGKSIIAHFSKEIPANVILKTTKLADVISVNKTLFVNEGEKLTPLKMDEENYLKLFPPVTRFAFHQGNIGNCRFISGSINNSMINPKKRINLYKMFEQQGNDILVTLPAFPDNPVLFKNGNIKLPKNNANLEGAPALQMIEQATAKGKLESEYQEIAGKPIEEIMESLNGGKNYYPISGRDGYCVFLPQIKDEFSKTQNFAVAPLEETLERFSDKTKYSLSANTKKVTEGIETNLDEDFNVYSSHSYSVCDINPEEKTVTISNPWNTGEWVKMSYDKFKKNFASLYIEEL